MNLLDNTINNLHDALDKFRKKKLSSDDLMKQIAAANTLHKFINTEIQVANLAINQKRAFNILQQKGIIDDTEAIDLDGDPELDKVKCPLHDNLITRSECLEYSGDKKHIDDCMNCEIGTATKDKLLGEKQ